jgi:hypothetical protein
MNDIATSRQAHFDALVTSRWEILKAQLSGTRGTVTRKQLSQLWGCSPSAANTQLWVWSKNGVIECVLVPRSDLTNPDGRRNVTVLDTNPPVDLLHERDRNRDRHRRSVKPMAPNREFVLDVLRSLLPAVPVVCGHEAELERLRKVEQDYLAIKDLLGVRS